MKKIAYTEYMRNLIYQDVEVYISDEDFTLLKNNKITMDEIADKYNDEAEFDGFLIVGIDPNYEFLGYEDLNLDLDVNKNKLEVR